MQETLTVRRYQKNFLCCYANIGASTKRHKSLISFYFDTSHFLLNPSPPRLFTPFLYIYLLLNNFSFPRAAVLVQNQSIPSLSFIILFIFYFHPLFLSSSPSSPSACKWFKNTLKLFFFQQTNVLLQQITFSPSSNRFFIFLPLPPPLSFSL